MPRDFWPLGVVTSFRAIEGANNLALRFSDGKEFRTDRILAWNRRQDWAILPAADKNESALKIADGKNWGVGDHCYWIDVKTDDSRIIGDGQIVGLEVSPGWGDRINISGIYNYTATGGPLLDEQGRVVGILGGALPASLINSVGSDISTDISEAAYYSTGGTSVAASLLPQSVGSAATSLKDLWAKGEMMPVVTDTLCSFRHADPRRQRRLKKESTCARRTRTKGRLSKRRYVGKRHHSFQCSREPEIEVGH